MSIEQMLERIDRLPDAERRRLLSVMEKWLIQNSAPRGRGNDDALRAVRESWASLALDPTSARWVAEDDELMYEPG